MVQRIVPATDGLIAAIEAENAQFPAEMRGIFAGETRVLHAIPHIVLDETVKKLKPVP